MTVVRCTILVIGACLTVVRQAKAQCVTRQKSGVLPEKDGQGTIQDLRKLVEQGGCKVNVCFALEGSSSISSEEFGAQRNIVRLISSVVMVDERA